MGRSRVAMGDIRQRVERSTAYQEEWMIKEEVTVSSSGEIVVQEVSRTLVETWKSDVRRVCDEFNISTGDAEQKLKEADKDADVKKELEPLRLGQTKPWANGPESTWDEPLDTYILRFEDHWSSRAQERGKHIIGTTERLAKMIEEKKLTEGSTHHQWELHLLGKYKEWAHSEGLRMTGDCSPWRPDFYDPKRIQQLQEEEAKAQLVQEAIWTALVMPPANEKGEANISLIHNTFMLMFQNGCSPDCPFVDPLTQLMTTPLEYPALYCSEAGRRQVAGLQHCKLGESAAAGFEAAAMASAIDAMMIQDGSFFSEDPKLVVRAKLKKDNEKLKTHEREPVNPMPRGYVPGYKNLHAEFVMVGTKAWSDKLAKAQAAARAEGSGDDTIDYSSFRV